MAKHPTKTALSLEWRLNHASSGMRSIIDKCRNHPRMRIAWSLLVIAIAGASPVRAQTPDPAPQAEDADDQRAEKSTRLEPYAPGTVERFLVAGEQRYLSRIFDPPRGLFMRFGGMPEGQGFAGGPAYRYSTAATSFTATSAVSRVGAWEATARFEAPRAQAAATMYTPRISRFWSAGAVFHRLPREDFWGLGQNLDSGVRTDYLLEEATADITGGLSPARWFTVAGTAETGPNAPEAERTRPCRTSSWFTAAPMRQERGSIWTTSGLGAKHTSTSRPRSRARRSAVATRSR